jgi:DivIVA domain-containing protein
MTVEFTPEVIRGTSFRATRRGYNTAEVDAFVERMAAAVDVLHVQLTDETERALKAEGALEKNSDTDESVRRTLVLAQRTAALAVAEANDDATHLREDAAAEAYTTRQEANDEAHRLVAEATDSAALAVIEATRSRTAAEEECAELRMVSTAAIAEAQASATARTAAARHDADAALTRRAEEGRQQLDRTIAALTAQQASLRTDVETLATYLATERARVLAVLTDATDEFARTLSPSPRPGEVVPAERSEPVATSPALTDAGAHPPMATYEVGPASARPETAAAGPGTASREPSSRPSTVLAVAVAAASDERPSSLLFTLEHEIRRDRPRTTSAGTGA